MGYSRSREYPLTTANTCNMVNTLTQSSRYHSLAPMYYRGAQAAIVVYDITNQVGIK